MLYPLYDKDAELTAWLEPDRHIFDTNMNWIAFISRGNVWSAESGEWLGSVSDDGVLTDTLGKVFAWRKSAKRINGTVRRVRPVRPTKPVRPTRPVRPTTPVRPTRPVTPVFGWSSLSLNGWLNQ